MTKLQFAFAQKSCRNCVVRTENTREFREEIRWLRAWHGLFGYPGADVFDAEGGGQIGVVGHAEPLGHSLAVEDEPERLMPVGVLDGVHDRPIDVPSEFLARPIETENVKRLGERPR